MWHSEIGERGCHRALLLLFSSETLGHALCLSEPQFPYLENGTVVLPGLCEEADEVSVLRHRQLLCAVKQGWASGGPG